MGGVTEGVSRLEFDYPAGMPHRVLMPLQPSAPRGQSGVGQGEVGFLGDECLQEADRAHQVAGILEFFGIGIPLVPR